MYNKITLILIWSHLLITTKLKLDGGHLPIANKIVVVFQIGSEYTPVRLPGGWVVKK